MKRKDVEDYLTPQEQARLRHPSDAALVEALEDVTAHLAAAISLLSRSPKTGAASNKMFDQMLVDYDNSAARGRAALAATKALAGSRAPSDAALVEAAIGAIALLDVAIAGTVFTKPQAGRITVNVERAQVVLDGLRAALDRNTVNGDE